MKRILATLLFNHFLFGVCPCCKQFTRFSTPEPVLTGHIPAELEGLVPRICKCQKNGCTSSVRAITSLELRPSHVEA